MAQTKSCEGCSQAHDCKKVYEHLGCTDGPSVTASVLLAFLTPVIVFIGALGGFGWLLREVVPGPYQTLLAAILALTATTGVMMVVRILARLHRKQ